MNIFKKMFAVKQIEVQEQKSLVETWLEIATEQKCSHLAIMRSTVDGNEYPLYIAKNQNSTDAVISELQSGEFKHVKTYAC